MSFIKIFDKINENYIFFLVILLFVLNSLKLFYTLSYHTVEKNSLYFFWNVSLRQRTRSDCIITVMLIRRANDVFHLSMVN